MKKKIILVFALIVVVSTILIYADKSKGKIKIDFADDNYEVITISSTAKLSNLAHGGLYSNIYFIDGELIEAREIGGKWSGKHNLFYNDGEFIVSNFGEIITFKGGKIQTESLKDDANTTYDSQLDASGRQINENHAMVNYWDFLEFYNFKTDEFFTINNGVVRGDIFYDEKNDIFTGIEEESYEEVNNVTVTKEGVKRTPYPVGAWPETRTAFHIEDNVVYSYNHEGTEGFFYENDLKTLKEINKTEVPIAGHFNDSVYNYAYKNIIGDNYIYATNDYKLVRYNFIDREYETYDISKYVTEREGYAKSTWIEFDYNLEDKTMYLLTENPNRTVTVYDLKLDKKILNYKNLDRAVRVNGLSVKKK